MRLTIDGRDVELPLHRFIGFAGEATTYGLLRGAPVRDFNVMSRRNAILHSCASERLAANDARDIAAARWNFVFVADGHASITASTEPLRVPRGASVIVENDPLRIEAMEEGCRIVVASFANASTGESTGEDAVIRDGPAQGR
jgi:environmental stress-induced protein Ves